MSVKSSQSKLETNKNFEAFGRFVSFPKLSDSKGWIRIDLNSIFQANLRFCSVEAKSHSSTNPGFGKAVV